MVERKSSKDAHPAKSSSTSKLFVLDTNVLMHDPTSLFRFEEHDVYLPIFTLEELEALEDLKLELRRELDAKVTKNDLIRSALHMLLEDQAANGQRSYARRKVRKD